MKIAAFFIFLIFVGLGFRAIARGVAAAKPVDDREFTGEFFNGGAP